MSKRIDKTLDDLVVNLKLTRPQSIEINTYNQQKTFTDRAFTDLEQQRAEILEHQRAEILEQERAEILKIYEDSVINDNFDDLNCYSFHQLTQLVQVMENDSNPQQFSFCHEFSKNTIYHDQQDSLTRFSSIVDKLKTEGDQLQSQNQHYFYSTQTYEQANTQRLNTNDQFHCKFQDNNRQRRHKEYFSDSMLKSNKKSYKSLAKKTTEGNFTKNKLEPIYAKLNLYHDKQNNHQSSNLASKSPVISMGTCRKTDYSSSKKKVFTSSKTLKKTFEHGATRQKIKDLNQKIRKQNHIIYQSQFKQKQKSWDISPLNSFKKSNIQPHKFSSYKLKLFG